VDFEDVGRWLDGEIAHIKEVIEKEIKPTTEKKFIAALRTASVKMEKLAEDLEKRRANRNA
jgi:hypothetical protein